MAHVQLNGESLTIDGVDMTGKVLAEGFSVEFAAAPGPPVVHMTIPTDVLEVDLPDVVIDALREPAVESTYDASISRDNEALRDLNAKLQRLIEQQDTRIRATGKAVAQGINKAASAAEAGQR